MNKMYLFSLAFISNTLIANKIDNELNSCLDKGVSTVEMVHCYSKATKKWDNDLNKTYKIIISSISENEKNTLRNSQRKWIEYRDAYFYFLRNYYSMDGSQWVVISAKERMDITKQKTIELKRIYESVQAK